MHIEHILLQVAVRLEKRPYAYIVYVRDAEAAKQRLRRMCQEYEEIPDSDKVICNGYVIELVKT